MTVVIAVVDDDVAILDSAKMVLETQAWQVETFSTGEDFLAAVTDNHRPHCLILDPHLPGINGAELAKAIEDADMSLPIIGLTARPTSPITQAVSHAGAHVMLLKPVSAETLIDTVRLVLGKTSGGTNCAAIKQLPRLMR